ncbi:hypothetical protein Tco_0925404 [Tanacetum coccineum]|uniref:Uncharacterized protein n=1 Tax=Tanacetum coccineum TaxID=301880 RepID=A0ABQ5D6S3_9ASTR
MISKWILDKIINDKDYSLVSDDPSYVTGGEPKYPQELFSAVDLLFLQFLVAMVFFVGVSLNRVIWVVIFVDVIIGVVIVVTIIRVVVLVTRDDSRIPLLAVIRSRRFLASCSAVGGVPVGPVFLLGLLALAIVAACALRAEKNAITNQVAMAAKVMGWCFKTLTTISGGILSHKKQPQVRMISQVLKDYGMIHNDGDGDNDAYDDDRDDDERDIRTKKYRGSNSSDGGNTRDGVKIASGVIGSGDEIVSEQVDTTKGTSTNTKFANQSTERKPSLQPVRKNFVVRQPNAFQYDHTKSSKNRVPQKVDETNDLSKPVTSNSVPTPQESKIVKHDNVIAPGMFRINPFKPSREEKYVPNKVRTSVRTTPITVSQPHVVTKKDVNSDSNGLSSTGVDNTAKTRRPQPRSNTKNDRVPSASKSSCNKNKEVEVEEHHRNLLLSKNKKHMSSECKHVKLDIRNDKSEVVCAMCKQCLLTANHDVCMLNYVNDMNSRGKKQKANVSNTENQKKQKPKVKKPKKVGSNERLASPKPSKPRFCLRWSPTGRFFDITGKIIASSESESQSDCSNGYPNLFMVRRLGLLQAYDQKLENENVELEFQVRNYEKEIAHLKTTYKNLFDSIKVTRTQTKAIIDSLQDKLHDTIYENAKLRAQLFDKVSDQKDTNKGTSANTKFAKQSILGKPPSSSRPKLYVVTPLPNSTAFPKVGETNALSKPVTSNSVPSSRESTVVNNERVIAPGIFRINPFKATRVDNFVPNKHVKTSVRTKPIIVSQPHVITKNDVNSKTNGFSPKDIRSTTRTRRPKPWNNPKSDKVPFKSKSGCLSNKLEKIEENHRSLQSSHYPNHTSSECNNIKLAFRNEKSEVICATCKQCLITANHDDCVLQYVNGMKSRKKNQSANVSKSANQKKHKAEVWKPKNVGSKEGFASPKPSKPRSCLRWSPTGRLFDLKGKIITSSESESQSDCSKGDNACTSNPQEPIRKRFPSSTFSMTGCQNWFDTLLIPLLSEYNLKDKEDHGDNECDT